jgi:hypothetical protein
MARRNISHQRVIALTGNLKTTFLIISLFLLVSLASAIPVTETITESGYFTAPTNVFVGQIKLVGGGGGALGGNGTWTGYGGYNATMVSLSDFPLVPGQRYYLSIGTGGLGAKGQYSTTSMDYLQGKAGTATTAFGYTATQGFSVTTTLPRNIVGGAGFLTESQLATSGLQGYGSSTASYGGSGGMGYGAGGGGGGSGGSGGYGGDGGTGASGVVQITYDIDASDMMISGTTYNAQTGAVLPSVTVALSQGSTSYSVTSDGSTGAFNIPSSIGISTGYTITEIVSKSGYYSEEFSFVPYVSQVVPQRLSLIPTTFNKYANGTISGIFRDQYGSSISTVSLTMTNTTGGTLSTTSTTAGFYFFNNVPKMSTWNAVATKTGYANVSHVFEMGYYV